MVLESKRQGVCRDNPFAEEPNAKAFYYPSRHRKLNRKEEKVVLSPNKSQTESELNSVDQLFLRGTNILLDETADVRESQGLDESWPSTERPSSCGFLDDHFVSSRPDLAEESFLHEDKLRPLNPLRKQEQLRTDLSSSTYVGKSVLQRYIDRFRHGTPMSREDRRQHERSELKEFWWLSSSPPTPSDASTPRDDVNGRTKKFTGFSKDEDKKIERRMLMNDFEDETTAEVQEKADRLLELSECSLGSSGPAISTEGLGSSTSSDVYSVRDYHSRLPVTSGDLPSTRYRLPDSRKGMPATESANKARKSIKPVIPSRTTGPEEDILYRWRLQRKLELARQGLPTLYVAKERKDEDSKLKEFRQRLSKSLLPSAEAPHPGKVTFTPRPESHGRTSQQVEVQTQTSESTNLADSHCYDQPALVSRPVVASPATSRGKPHAVTVDPHLHFMCDLLPCSHQHELAGNTGHRTEQTVRINSDLNSSNSECDSDTHGTRYKQYLQAEKPDSENKKRSRSETLRHRSENFVEGPDGVESASENKKRSSIKVRQDSSEDLVEVSSDGVEAESEDKKRSRTKIRKDNRNNFADSRESGEQARHNHYKDDETRKSRAGRVRSSGLDARDTGLKKGRDKRNGKEIHSDSRHRVQDESTSKPSAKVGRGSSGAGFSDVSNGDRNANATQDMDDEKESETMDRVLVSSQISDVVADSMVTESCDELTLPKIRMSSSPQIRAARLNSAIGQVVQDHLFSRSELTVVSSVDSWTSLTDHRQRSGERCEDETLDTAMTAEKPALDTGTTCDRYESDEEFPDDNLLQILRRQRVHFEDKLRNIDSLLAQASLNR
ncbi:uncharacterized protein LOC121386291 [Gigantopelta aegis]|uniref:uncharacterized protein LOC121386291 n=1 Tax=Gigantopelta aegis TaxID=1735272 RepID=UPI001B889A4B|nr:uncharacterized protein LOC121386291 [Gigantopelta aegis]